MNPLEFYKQFMGPDDLVFDIGANTGSRTAIFAQLARKVIAVEPVVRILAFKYENVIFEACACGETDGIQHIFYDPEVTSLSSMSGDWMEAVTSTRRFGDRKWRKTKRVNVTTLDTLIATYGLPAFIKIDVEGYELSVLRGLSQPVKALSFEWHPEVIDSTLACINECLRLGMNQFAISEKETFELGPWQNAQEAFAVLEKYDGNVMYGDLYVRV